MKNGIYNKIDSHSLWLRTGGAEGEQADFSGADLRSANLAGANLSGANLAGANLAWANLSGANLAGANLSGANLAMAILDRADLHGANLTGTILEKKKKTVSSVSPSFAEELQAKISEIESFLDMRGMKLASPISVLPK